MFLVFCIFVQNKKEHDKDKGNFKGKKANT